jgi:hypothetical protein
MKPIMTLALALSAIAAVGASTALAASSDRDKDSDKASSASEAVKRAFGNTIVTTYPDGRHGYLWLSADGTFRTMGRHKTQSTGKWRIKGDQVCLKRQHPPAPFSYCTSAPQGDSWPAKAVTGEKLQAKLVKGIVKG